MRVVRVRGRHFNGRIQLRDESSFGEGGAYARDKNTSGRLCAKNAGGLMRKGGGVFVGHYGSHCDNIARLKESFLCCQIFHSTNKSSERRG